MIISGVDRYIASWFRTLNRAHVHLSVSFYADSPSCAAGTTIRSANYYVYSVSSSEGTVTVVFGTDSTATLRDILSASFIGVHGEVSLCVGAYSTVNQSINIGGLQLIAVFRV